MEVREAMGGVRRARAMAVAAALCAVAVPARAETPPAGAPTPPPAEAPAAPAADAPAPAPATPRANEPAEAPAAPTPPTATAAATFGEPGMGMSVLLEFGAYYSSAGVYIPLVRKPVPHVGERSEAELYAALLPRSPIPRFVVLEASVNPMPCLGLLVRDKEERFYDRAQIDQTTNLVRAATAGFEEPWAVSLFVGNLAYYGVPGRPDMRGMGYFGTVLSAGTTHIKDNVAIPDGWVELEMKLKGDRRSAVKKLGWSFRLGAKLHDNPDVTDTIFLGVRRSRVDYVGGPPLLRNSGFEYRFDLSMEGLPIRHRFLVDKKWPLGEHVTASFALGIMWESGRAYTGALGEGTHERVQMLVRPNLEF